MSRAATREAAVAAAAKPASPLTVEPGALGPGLRDWFSSLGQYPVKAAAFDTRIDAPAALTGRASNTWAVSLLWDPLHCIMQTRQFHNLRTRVSAQV
jgi:hypothetical protein